MQPEVQHWLGLVFALSLSAFAGWTAVSWLVR